MKTFPMRSLGVKLHTNVATFITPPPPHSLPTHQLQLSYRVPYRKHPTPLPETDPGGTITMVTSSGRSFTQQINTEDTAVQETNPAIPGQLVHACKQSIPSGALLLPSSSQMSYTVTVYCISTTL